MIRLHARTGDHPNVQVRALDDHHPVGRRRYAPCRVTVESSRLGDADDATADVRTATE